MDETAAHPSSPSLLTHTEAAAYLGVTPKRLTNLQGGVHHVSHIPTCRVGGRILYDIADLDAWIAAHGKGPHYVRGTPSQAVDSPTGGAGQAKRDLLSKLIERMVRIEQKVDKLSEQVSKAPRAPAPTQPSPTRRRYMNVQEAADYLRVSRRVIYESAIPKVRFGRRILLDRQRLDEWLAASVLVSGTYFLQVRSKYLTP